MTMKIGILIMNMILILILELVVSPSSDYSILVAKEKRK